VTKPELGLLRFVYGQETNFLNTQLAIQVYKFANKMLMEHLTNSLDNYFTTVDAQMIFTVFDLYKTLNIAHGLEFCREVRKRNK